MTGAIEEMGVTSLKPYTPPYVTPTWLYVIPVSLYVILGLETAP
jgi:hypothetical protein